MTSVGTRKREKSIKADMKIGEYTFKLEAPDSHQVHEYQKSQTKYKIIFDKVKELIRDDPNIQKEAPPQPLSISSIPSDIRHFKVPASDYSDLSLPRVDRETYTQLLLRAFNELNFKWTVADKVWIKHYKKYGKDIQLDRSSNFIKIYPEKQISKKGDKNFKTFLEENSKANAAAAAAAASIPITEPVSSSKPLKKQKQSKLRDYGLGYSTTIIAVKKTPSAQKHSLFVVDNTQNAVYDFWKWKAQSQDYDNKIEEPGPVGYITGNNMPEPLFKWKEYRDHSYLAGETQQNLNGIQTDRLGNNGEYIEIGGLFYYLLKPGYELEFFPEPEPEKQEISLKRITYSKSRSQDLTKSRRPKTYLKSETLNEDGSYDIYADDEDIADQDDPEPIGEMDPDDGIIRFNYEGYDSEDDKLSSSYPYEKLTTYQVDKKTLKEHDALSKANKELYDANLGDDFGGVGWKVSWDSSFQRKDGKGGLLYEHENWYENREDARNGDHVFERYLDEVLLYDTQTDANDIIKKKIDRFLTKDQLNNGWQAVYSKSKFKTYYFNKNNGKSVWQYKDVTIQLDSNGAPFTSTNISTGGKKKTKKNIIKRNRTFKK